MNAFSWINAERRLLQAGRAAAHAARRGNAGKHFILTQIPHFAPRFAEESDLSRFPQTSFFPPDNARHPLLF